MNRKKLKKIILIVLLLILVGAGGGAWYFYRLFYSPNIYVTGGEKTFVDIDENIISVDDVLSILEKQAKIKNSGSLKQAVAIKQYKTVRPGHYEIKNGMSNKTLVTMLQRGLQTPVRVTFNNIRTKEQLAGVFSNKLMADSVAILNLLNNEHFVSSYGFTTDNILAMFLPNTYEFFWNTNAEKVFERMNKEYQKFWNETRIQQAAAIPLAPIEVSILASIVEEETNKVSEYPIVAGLYINRLKKGMLLQADPTVKYAVGDFALRRVLNVHLKTDSPYNTYLYTGLPPGPIRVPSTRCIDAVLNYEKHNYLYMVAKETLNGEHSFATTLSEHNKNARKYWNALNKLQIYH